MKLEILFSPYELECLKVRLAKREARCVAEHFKDVILADLEKAKIG